MTEDGSNNMVISYNGTNVVKIASDGHTSVDDVNIQHNIRVIMAMAASGAISFSDLRRIQRHWCCQLRLLSWGGVKLCESACRKQHSHKSVSWGSHPLINFTNFRSQAEVSLYLYKRANQAGRLFEQTGCRLSKRYRHQFWCYTRRHECLRSSEISTGGLGTITITNNSTLIGAGGAANGSNGGDAFEAFVTCTSTMGAFCWWRGWRARRVRRHRRRRSIYHVLHRLKPTLCHSRRW